MLFRSRKGAKGPQAPPQKVPPSVIPDPFKAKENPRAGNSFEALEAQDPTSAPHEEGEIPQNSSSRAKIVDDIAEGSKIAETAGKIGQEDKNQETAGEGGSEEEGSEGDSEASIPSKKERRGRKTDRERREIATYRDKAAGVQPSLEKIISSRNTRQQGAAPKGATPMTKSK